MPNIFDDLVSEQDSTPNIFDELASEKESLRGQMREARAEAYGNKAISGLANIGERIAYTSALVGAKADPTGVVHNMLVREGYEVPTVIPPQAIEQDIRTVGQFGREALGNLGIRPGPVSPEIERPLTEFAAENAAGLIEAAPQLALGKFQPRPVARYFQAQMAAGLPGSIEQVVQSETPEEKLKTGLQLGANVAFPAAIELGLRKQPIRIPDIPGSVLRMPEGAEPRIEPLPAIDIGPKPSPPRPLPEIKSIASETGVPEETVAKGVRVEANDHPEVAKTNPELLPTLVKDELKLDKTAYDKDKDPGTETVKPEPLPEPVPPAAPAEVNRVKELTDRLPVVERLIAKPVRKADTPLFEKERQNILYELDSLDALPTGYVKEGNTYVSKSTQPPPAVSEAKPSAKQPWEMTRDEIIARAKKNIESSGGVDVNGSYLVGENHREIVRDALSEGKPVPAEVLKDYPELAPKQPPPQPSAGIEKQGKEGKKPFEVDDQLVMRSPHTGEDTLVSFRGLMPDGKAVVWTGKSQFPVPIEWLRRQGEKYEEQVSSKNKSVGSASMEVAENKNLVKVPSESGRPLSNLSKEELVDLYRKEVPLAGTTLRSALLKKTLKSLRQDIENARINSQREAQELELTRQIEPEIRKLADDAGPAWRTALNKYAKDRGWSFNPPSDTTKGEYVAMLALQQAKKQLKESTTRPQPGPGAQTVGETPIAQGPGARTAKAEVPESYEGTGLKNAIGEVERVSYGLPEATPTEKRAMGKAWIRSELLLEKDPLAGQKLLDALAENPKRGLSDDESALLLRHKVKIENDLNAAAERTFTATDDVAKAHAQAEFNVLSDQLLKMLDAAKARGSEWGREGKWRQAIANEDFSLATMVTRKRMALGGRKLTEPELDAVKKAQAEVEATRKAYEKHVEESKAREEELQKQVAFEKARTEAKEPEIHPKIIQIAETIVKQLDNKADAARARIKARMSRMSAGVDPTVILDLTEIGASHLAHRVLDFAKWSDRMIGEFGDWVKPHLDEVFKNAQLRIDALAEAHGKQRAPQIKKALKQPTLEETKLAIAEKVKERVAKKEFNKITWYLNLLARRLYESGVTEREPMVDALHDVLKSVMPEVTRQETARMWSGYGDYRQLSKDQISVGLRSMKGELLEISKLEDMEAGQPPLKSGHERGEISEARRQLIKKVNDAKYKFQIPIQDPATQLKSALDTYKTILTNRIADLEDRMARKDFAPRPRRELILDEKAFELRAKAERVKQRYNRELEKDRKSRQAPWQRRLEKFVEWERAFKLSSPVVFGKLGAAAVTRGVTTGTEEVLGGILKRMPVISKIAEQAPREGSGLSLQAASKAIASAVTEGIKDAKQTAKTGMTDLDILLGKEGGLDREWVNMFGQLHGMVKAPVKRAEYTYSLEQRIAHAIRNGEDVLNKQVMQRLMTESMNDGYRSIFMQKGFSSQMFTAMVHMMESSKSYQPIGEISARLTRFLLPIVRVPVNIVGETMTGVTGIPLASTRIMFHAMKGGLKNMDPVVADSIMRQLKKGSIGAALMAIGFMNPENVGGYDWKQKRKPGEVKSGGFQIFGKDVPRWVTHAPWFELMQMGGTIRRVSEEKYKTGTKGLGAGVLAAQVGLLEETPFYGQMVRTVRAGESAQAANRAFGELARSTVVPQFFQQIAKLIDKEEKRNPTTPWEHIKYGIPGLRNTVPVKPPTNSGVSAVMFPK